MLEERDRFLPSVSFGFRLFKLTEVPSVIKEPAKLCWLGLELFHP